MKTPVPTNESYDTLTLSEAAALDRALATADRRFDPAVSLLRGEVGPARYHTRLAPGTPVHVIHESAVYAAAALAGSETARYEKAISIIEALLPLQETAPSSDWRGIWPWFAEEPVREMSPPDRNFADFVAVPLIQVLKSGQLTDSLRRRVESALGLAADAIRQRDVRLSYTNIAIMGIYVCVAAGEILRDSTLREHGQLRLRRFVEFTRESQGFPEYNSPTYTPISLVELTRMLRDFSDEDDLRLVREIHDLAWREIARHWHAPSGQWAGPHGRSYATLLLPDTRAFVEKGIRGTVPEDVDLRLDWAMMPIRCPEELKPYFLDPAPCAHHVTVASADPRPLWRHTHLRPEFTLGSVERGTFWNQSRSLVAYAPTDGEAAAFALRFLHDHYDFCAAHLLCRQAEACVLGAICLAMDGGDKHPELDRFPDGKITAGDWRVRLEFFNLSPDAIRETDGRWTVEFGREARLEFAWLETHFGDLPPIVQISREENRTYLDFVFYHGTARSFDFSAHFVSALSFAMRVVPSADSPVWADPEVLPEGARKTLRWTTDSGECLEFQAPTEACKESAILDYARGNTPEKSPAL